MKGLMERVRTTPGAEKFIVMGLSLTVLSVGGILSWLGATAPPQIVSEPVIEQSGEWLYTATPDLDYSTEQVRLFMMNTDPTRGQPGLLWNQVSAEAIRMIGMASINIQNPKDKCFAKSTVECLELFEINIQKEYSKAILPSDKAKAILRFYAAEMAINSIIGQKPIVAGDVQNDLFQVVMEKARVDRGAARLASPDGVAASYRKAQEDAAKEQKAREDFSNE